MIPRFSWALGAVAVLLAGVILGRHTASPAPAALQPDSGRVVDLRVAEYDAATDNVRLEVATVTTHELSGGIGDAAVQRLLATALAGDLRADVRLQAVELLRLAVADAEIESALINALQHDANPGVRVQAAAALQEMAGSQTVRAALRQALQEDPNHGVRVASISALRNYREQATVELFERTSRTADTEYLRMTARQTLADWDVEQTTVQQL
jgi:hypothetical protein